MGLKNILYKVENGIAEIVLNRPEKMNSLDEQMIKDITVLFSDFEKNIDVSVIVLTGSGGNFCSGLYLDYLQNISKYDIIENKKDSERFRDMLLSIYNCPKPTIAKVSGYALAGGCGLATACDLIVADETAKFGYTEVKIGFIPAIVMVFLLKRTSESNARDLLLTSRMVGSDEAMRIGLINRAVSSKVLDESVAELCQVLKMNPGSSVALTKEMLRNVPAMSFEKALDYACSMNAITRMTEDCRKGIAKFLSKK